MPEVSLRHCDCLRVCSPQPVENYTPDIAKCADGLEPFAVLWETIGQYIEAQGRWYKTPLLKLNPVGVGSTSLFPSTHQGALRARRDFFAEGRAEG